MAHPALYKTPGGSRITQMAIQKFRYLLVLDFEATCDRPQLKQQEIIEVPCLAISTTDWKSKSLFHEYVKPKINPEITTFCTDLTGIMQETVEKQPYFPEIFSQFNSWVEEGEYFKAENNSAFITCSNWDLRVMLPKQCALDNLMVPEYYKKWIDIKHIFCEATGYYPRNMKDMLNRLNLPLEGRWHCGLNDVQNIAKIVCTLGEKYNTVFDITSVKDTYIGKLQATR